MALDLQNKICFITGGGSGAGFGQAQIFSDAGCKIVIADRSEENLAEAMKYFEAKGAPAHAIVLDVTKHDEYAAAADETERVFGAPPEIVVLTAGVNAFGPAEASTYDDFDWIVGTNLKGIYYGYVTFVPRMIKAGRGGWIVTCASLAAFAPDILCAPYACSKAAVVSLATSYHEALKPYGIHSMVFCPGNMNTNIHNAHKSRPASLSKSGYYISDDVARVYEKHNLIGMDIREVGRRTLMGMEEGVVICIPYEEREEIIKAETERTRNFCTTEGMERIEEAKRQAKLRSSGTDEEARLMAESFAAGLGKAADDVDWVDSDKKFSK